MNKTLMEFNNDLNNADLITERLEEALEEDRKPKSAQKQQWVWKDTPEKYELVNGLEFIQDIRVRLLGLPKIPRWVGETFGSSQPMTMPALVDIWPKNTYRRKVEGGLIVKILYVPQPLYYFRFDNSPGLEWYQMDPKRLPSFLLDDFRNYDPTAHYPMIQPNTDYSSSVVVKGKPRPRHISSSDITFQNRTTGLRLGILRDDIRAIIYADHINEEIFAEPLYKDGERYGNVVGIPIEGNMEIFKQIPFGLNKNPKTGPQWFAEFLKQTKLQNQYIEWGPNDETVVLRESVVPYHPHIDLEDESDGDDDSEIEPPHHDLPDLEDLSDNDDSDIEPPNHDLPDKPDFSVPIDVRVEASNQATQRQLQQAQRQLKNQWEKQNTKSSGPPPAGPQPAGLVHAGPQPAAVQTKEMKPLLPLPLPYQFPYGFGMSVVPVPVLAPVVVYHTKL